jgi:hypothetical protein
MNPTWSRESQAGDDIEQKVIIRRFWIVTLGTAAVILEIALGFLMLQYLRT